ncbi:MAG: hypothetical protein ACTJLL_00505 [Anaplasma sp.]
MFSPSPLLSLVQATLSLPRSLVLVVVAAGQVCGSCFNVAVAGVAVAALSLLAVAAGVGAIGAVGATNTQITFSAVAVSQCYWSATAVGLAPSTTPRIRF